jgi:hypothetical protein
VNTGWAVYTFIYMVKKGLGLAARRQKDLNLNRMVKAII